MKQSCANAITTKQMAWTDETEKPQINIMSNQMRQYHKYCEVYKKELWNNYIKSDKTRLIKYAESISSQPGALQDSHQNSVLIAGCLQLEDMP